MGALAGLAIGGSAVGGDLLGMVGQNQQNVVNERMLSQEEAYNTQMADTVAQRSVADLKAAGLNPILAAGGSIDTAPSVGPVPQGSPVSAGLSAAQSSMSSALQAAQGIKQLDVADSQAKLNQANATVALKNADAKSLNSDVMSDLDSVYQSTKSSANDVLSNFNASDMGSYLKSNLLDWYRRAFGSGQTNAPGAGSSDDSGPSLVPASAGGLQ